MKGCPVYIVGFGSIEIINLSYLFEARWSIDLQVVIDKSQCDKRHSSPTNGLNCLFWESSELPGKKDVWITGARKTRKHKVM